MASFDVVLWKERADARYHQAVARGKDRATALTKWQHDVASIAALERLINWCVDRSIEVIFCRCSAGVFYPQDKRVKVSARASPEVQLHVLLHECGHYLVGDKEKHDRYGMGYSQSDPNVKRTFHYRCDILDEEFEAWHRGWKLAQRLNLRLDKARYDKTRVKMLHSYMCWALKVKGYNGKDDDDDDDKKSESHREAVAGRCAI